jgi:peptidoglycan/xylan/chitin deacetylase (PgdA/CDA1 family)
MLGFLISAATAALATTAGYNSMAPRSQLFGRTFTGNGNGRQLALTYDDGPNSTYTPRLLEVLARHNVRATFFMIGHHVVEAPEVAREVAAAGHVIGNHTYTHPNLIFSSRAQVLAQVEDCYRVITQVVGEHSRLFRPPFGGRRPSVLRLARERGFIPVMWSVSAYDWNPLAPDEIVAKVTRHVRGGDVILMHDGGHIQMGADRSATIEATDRLITHYRQQGFEFVTIPEMMKG